MNRWQFFCAVFIEAYSLAEKAGNRASKIGLYLVSILTGFLAIGSGDKVVGIFSVLVLGVMFVWALFDKSFRIYRKQYDKAKRAKSRTKEKLKEQAKENEKNLADLVKTHDSKIAERDTAHREKVADLNRQLAAASADPQKVLMKNAISGFHSRLREIVELINKGVTHAPNSRTKSLSEATSDIRVNLATWTEKNMPAYCHALNDDSKFHPDIPPRISPEDRKSWWRNAMFLMMRLEEMGQALGMDLRSG